MSAPPYLPADATTAPGLKRDIQAFWGEVYRTAYAAPDAELTPETLARALDELEDMFRYRAHLAVTEMPETLAGLRVLEVGSGAGGHSALFAKKGARVTALDLTADRARATHAKLDLLAAPGCAAVQGDAERLPFADGTFDIVYSNGVIHHSPRTDIAADEIFRVLKPGGRAVVMLYCKSSFHYWFTLFLCTGLLKGAMFRSRDWLGRATEWIGESPQTAINPITRCYTAREVRHLFRRFERVHLRKSEFALAFVPKLGRLWRARRTRQGKLHPGGMLVYGAPWLIAAPFELKLGRHVGWAWNIAAKKPA